MILIASTSMWGVRAKAVYVVVECYSCHRFVTVWEYVLKEPKLKPLLTQRSPTRRRLRLPCVVLLPISSMSRGVEVPDSMRPVEIFPRRISRAAPFALDTSTKIVHCWPPQGHTFDILLSFGIKRLLYRINFDVPKGVLFSRIDALFLQ